jgi:hypothetical protein
MLKNEWHFLDQHKDVAGNDLLPQTVVILVSCLETFYIVVDCDCFQLLCVIAHRNVKGKRRVE